MIVVPLKEGENIEKALKKFKESSKNRCSKRIEKPSGFRKTLCSKEKTNYACCLRSAITAGRRIKIQNLSARLVLLDSYSYFRCHKSWCNVNVLIDSFLDYLRYERNYSEYTINAYFKDLQQFEDFVKEKKEAYLCRRKLIRILYGIGLYFCWIIRFRPYLSIGNWVLWNLFLNSLWSRDSFL